MFYFLVLFCVKINGLVNISGLNYYETVLYNPEEMKLKYNKFLTSGEKFFKFELKVFDQIFQFQLESDNYNMEISRNGKSKHIERSQLLKGSIIGEFDSMVAGHIDRGLFRGKVTLKELQFEIFPSHYFKELDSLQHVHTIAFRLSFNQGTDLKNRSVSRCGHCDSMISNSQPNIQEIKFRKKRGTISGPMICDVKVFVDYPFFKKIKLLRGSDDLSMTYITNEVKLLISKVSHIYKTTKFKDGSTIYNNITIMPTSLMVDTDNEWDLSKIGPVSSNIHLNKFTSLFSTYRGDECVRALVTGISHGDVIGLAYVGSDIWSGICQTMNTMFISVHSSSNTFISLQDSTVLFSHEMGHLFSSIHDKPGTPCSPGDNSPNGNYIMTAYASNVVKYNTDKFSSCSIEQIGSLITKRISCFKTKHLSTCGNRILEENEECEPNSSNDPCCSNKCKFKDPKYSCSSLHGPCCVNCQMAKASDKYQCRNATTCSLATLCDGTKYECPKIVGTNENKLCTINIEKEKRYFLCNKGACNESICKLDVGWSQCLPRTDSPIQNCLLGCENKAISKSCILSSDIKNLPPNLKNFIKEKNIISVPTSIESNCYKDSKQKDSAKSYCDFKHICRDKISDTSIGSIITKLLNSNIFKKLKEQLMKNMWIAPVACVAFILITFCLVLICAPPLKSDNPKVSKKFSIRKAKYKEV